MSLNLVESFLSIQGEGASSGRLAIFLRFAGCNLNCAGFGVLAVSPKTGETLVGCDTIRAVFTGHFSYQKITRTDELIKITQNLSATLCQKPIIVITGGEPLLHHKDQILLDFLNFATSEGYEPHFETNGTIEVDFAKFEIYKRCRFAVSVKLENSGESEARRINPAALKAIKQNAAGSFYKFVLDKKSVENGSAIAQISRILGICDAEVFCMPQGYDKISLEQNALSVAQFAIKHGFSYSDRLHIRLWGAKEGV